MATQGVDRTRTFSDSPMHGQSVKRTFQNARHRDSVGRQSQHLEGGPCARRGTQDTRAQERGGSQDVRSGTEPRTRTRPSVQPTPTALSAPTLRRHDSTNRVSHVNNPRSFHNATTLRSPHITLASPRTPAPSRRCCRDRQQGQVETERHARGLGHDRHVEVQRPLQ